MFVKTSLCPGSGAKGIGLRVRMAFRKLGVDAVCGSQDVYLKRYLRRGTPLPQVAGGASSGRNDGVVMSRWLLVKIASPWLMR